jgi:hypothetical protein
MRASTRAWIDWKPSCGILLEASFEEIRPDDADG